MTEQRCNKCQFWSVFFIDKQATFKRGTCRRMPPVIDLLAVHSEIHHYKDNGKSSHDETAHRATMWTQPTTYEDMSCGEFKNVTS